MFSMFFMLLLLLAAAAAAVVRCRGPTLLCDEWAPRLMARVFCACALVWASPCIVCACVIVFGSERGRCGANPWVLTLMRVRVVVLSYNPRVVNRRAPADVKLSTTTK